MASWKLAPTLVVLQKEIDRHYPNRDKTSDGTKGDSAHSARSSDHNPDNRNVVCAWDIDENVLGKPGPYPSFGTGAPASGIRDRILALAKAGKLPQLYYIIYEGYIYSRTYQFAKRKYTGANPHKNHMHLSVYHAPALADRKTPWNLFATDPSKPPTITDKDDDDMPLSKEDIDKIADEVMSRVMTQDIQPGPNKHSLSWYIRATYDNLKQHRETEPKK